jgi:hypothetical protein
LSARGGRAVVVLGVVAALASLGVACQTVDLGTPPADINACRPSQSFFVQQIWPNVLSKDYGGTHCYQSNCHSTIGGAGRLALIASPQPVLDPTMPPPQPLPDDWQKNYRSATEVMNCSDVQASKLILYPTAQTSHGGGKLFDPAGPEALLIEMWVTAP